MSLRSPLLSVRRPVGPRSAAFLKLLAFLLPLGLWCAVSYSPHIWKPYVRVVDAGDSKLASPGVLIDRAAFERESSELIERNLRPPKGYPSSPIYLPAPHTVAAALVTAFTTPPQRKGDPWLHESIWHSITIILWGFLLSAALGVPLGILCGTFDAFSKLVEPFIDFLRYMPAPAFGALVVAFLGIYDGPKIAIIFIGTFFQLVLIVANTTRTLDRSLLEAAQTLGASNRQLLTRVTLPGILPELYDNLRIMLGWAWTYLLIAELIGASSGISYFINQQGKLSRYENVYAGIIIIGFIGLIMDQILSYLKPFFFPWTPGGRRVGGASGKPKETGVTCTKSPQDRRDPLFAGESK